MADLILPSKLVSERVTVQFEFKDVLEWNETISGRMLTVSVESGEDSSPNLLLYKQAVVIGTTVIQQLQLGTPGVIYKIECVITGSSGEIYTKWTRLAILPDNALNPPIVARWLTSWIYPLEDIESFAGGPSIPLSGYSIKWPREGFNDSSNVVSGTLSQILIRYENGKPEGFNDTSSIVLGDLYSSLKTYVNGKPEGFNSTSLVQTGSLDQILIRYTHKPEGFNDSSSIVSGSLT